MTQESKDNLYFNAFLFSCYVVYLHVHIGKGVYTFLQICQIIVL